MPIGRGVSNDPTQLDDREAPVRSRGGWRDRGWQTARRQRWVEVCLGCRRDGSFEKRIRFAQDGAVEVLFNWDPRGSPRTASFPRNFPWGPRRQFLAVPESEPWRFPISTFSKSEKGFDETVQGESVTIRWPIRRAGGGFG